MSEVQKRIDFIHAKYEIAARVRMDHIEFVPAFRLFDPSNIRLVTHDDYFQVIKGKIPSIESEKIGVIRENFTKFSEGKPLFDYAAFLDAIDSTISADNSRKDLFISMTEYLTNKKISFLRHMHDLDSIEKKGGFTISLLEKLLSVYNIPIAGVDLGELFVQIIGFKDDSKISFEEFKSRVVSLVTDYVDPADDVQPSNFSELEKIAHDNDLLLVKIKAALKTQGFGAISEFFNVKFKSSLSAGLTMDSEAYKGAIRELCPEISVKELDKILELSLVSPDTMSIDKLDQLVIKHTFMSQKQKSKAKLEQINRKEELRVILKDFAFFATKQKTNLKDMFGAFDTGKEGKIPLEIFHEIIAKKGFNFLTTELQLLDDEYSSPAPKMFNYKEFELDIIAVDEKYAELVGIKDFEEERTKASVLAGIVKKICGNHATLEDFCFHIDKQKRKYLTNITVLNGFKEYDPNLTVVEFNAIFNLINPKKELKVYFHNFVHALKPY